MQMEWISVDDRLPEVPRGKHAVPVLVVTYDSIYAEITNTTSGYEVQNASFDRENNDFETLYIPGAGEGSYFGPMGDPVKYWMYLPEPPEKGAHWQTVSASPSPLTATSMGDESL